jgi:hypothetical protein
LTVAVKVKSIGKFIVFLTVLCVVTIITFFIYASLSDLVEVERVKKAISRDCSTELEISPDDISEPGVIMKNYVSNAIPMMVICQGPNWLCTCTENR